MGIESIAETWVQGHPDTPPTCFWVACPLTLVFGVPQPRPCSQLRVIHTIRDLGLYVVCVVRSGRVPYGRLYLGRSSAMS